MTSQQIRNELSDRILLATINARDASRNVLKMLDVAGGGVFTDSEVEQTKAVCETLFSTYETGRTLAAMIDARNCEQ